MKQFTFIIAYICLAFFSPVLHAQTKVYKGTLGDRQIEMHLLTTKFGMYGYYFYKKIPWLIPLLAEERNKRIRLIQDDPFGDIFFSISTSGRTISGKWNNHEHDTDISVPFSVSETGPETVNKNFARYSGDYEARVNGSLKELGVYFINNNHLYFNMSVGSADCQGLLSAIAKIQSANMAVFTGPDCIVTITWHNDEITIQEGDCTNQHGANCDFNGVYKKR